mmetsp:Transcript_51918/g.145008  ORF Transcript_51918/g.145008 Transcript_51918/m.145008 type:complete len:229 (+) Transcript_51918:408-1094(+)
MEKVWMTQLLPILVLRHGGDDAQGRERTEQGCFQDEGPPVGIHAEVVKRVVAALQRLVRLYNRGVDAGVKLLAQIRGALAVAVPFRLPDRVCRQLAIGACSQLVCRRADVFQKVLDLRQHRERPVRLLHNRRAHLAPGDVFIDDDPGVEAERVIQSRGRVFVAPHERDPARVVLVARLHDEGDTHGCGPLLLPLHEQLASGHRDSRWLQHMLRRRLVGRRPHSVVVVP